MDRNIISNQLSPSQESPGAPLYSLESIQNLTNNETCSKPHLSQSQIEQSEEEQKNFSESEREITSNLTSHSIPSDSDDSNHSEINESFNSSGVYMGEVHELQNNNKTCIQVNKSKLQINKQKKIQWGYRLIGDKRKHSDLSMISQIKENMEFFLFCDIVIEKKLILGKNMEQTKRSDINSSKRIGCILDNDKLGFIEVQLYNLIEPMMNFKGVCSYLDSMQDNYSHQVSLELEKLQKKTEMGYQAAQLLRNNAVLYDFMIQRKEYSDKKYEEFKQKTLPQYTQYLYNHYTFNMETGNISILNKGISKRFLEILTITPDNFKEKLSLIGIVEFLKRDYKTAFTISYFNQFVYNMNNFPERLSFRSEFITLDNIQVSFQVDHFLINLCENFDQQNNFQCPFIDFVCLIVPHVTDEFIQQLAKIRQEQNININSLLEMSDDEIDVYFSLETQSFLKRYYKDIYSRPLPNFQSHLSKIKS